MDINNLVKILHGDIDLIDQLNVHDIALFEDRVVIYPHDVRTMLQRFLDGHLLADDLNKWAEFICLRGEYSSPNWENQDMLDYYEDMWYVIQRLSTPEIDGEITKARVKGYLTELEKYNSLQEAWHQMSIKNRWGQILKDPHEIFNDKKT